MPKSGQGISPQIFNLKVSCSDQRISPQIFNLKVSCLNHAGAKGEALCYTLDPHGSSASSQAWSRIKNQASVTESRC